MNFASIMAYATAAVALMTAMMVVIQGRRFIGEKPRAFYVASLLSILTAALTTVFASELSSHEQFTRLVVRDLAEQMVDKSYEPFVKVETSLVVKMFEGGTKSIAWTEYRVVVPALDYPVDQWTVTNRPVLQASK